MVIYSTINYQSNYFVGAIGSAIANPTDVVKVRLQAQGKVNPGETLRHSGAFSAFSDILKQEGKSPLVCKDSR